MYICNNKTTKCPCLLPQQKHDVYEKIPWRPVNPTQVSCDHTWKETIFELPLIPCSLGTVQTAIVDHTKAIMHCGIFLQNAEKIPFFSRFGPTDRGSMSGKKNFPGPLYRREFDGACCKNDRSLGQKRLLKIWLAVVEKFLGRPLVLLRNFRIVHLTVRKITNGNG